MDNFRISQTELFHKLVKKLSKRYKHLEIDLDDFIDSIQSVNDLGIPLGKNVYKVRIKNSDTNKGKSSGYRLISYLEITAKEITFLYIYSKSDISNLKETDIDDLVLQLINKI